MCSRYSPTLSFNPFTQALGFVYDPELVKSVFEQAASRYGERPGGYTRVKPVIQPRRGDSAEMATIELV